MCCIKKDGSCEYVVICRVRVFNIQMCCIKKDGSCEYVVVCRVHVSMSLYVELGCLTYQCVV